MGVICPSRVGPAGRPAVGIVRQARRPLRSTKIDLASQCAFRQTHWSEGLLRIATVGLRRESCNHHSTSAIGSLGSQVELSLKPRDLRGMTVPELRALYEETKRRPDDESWHKGFVAACERARNAAEAEFRSAAFQQSLWEEREVSGIGPGSSVTVPGAYTDAAVVDVLWRVRQYDRATEARQLAQQLDADFKTIIDMVSPRYSSRRPLARLVRLFVTLRPEDLFCLMDWHRTIKVRQYVGAGSMSLGLIGQNVIARRTAIEQLGNPSSIAEAVSQSQFGWFLWENIKAADDEGTRPTPQPDQPHRPTDAPTLALLPAQMQRKGMFYVSNNLDLLLSLVRAAEHGMERGDLVNQLTEEAPGLKQSSRQNVIAQAVSLSLLKVDGAVLTLGPSGKALLEGSAAADILTPTFVRNVFGFGLVLADLRDETAKTLGEIAKRCRDYYAGWTTDFAPNSLVRWLRDLGLAEIDGGGKLARVTLTEAGEYWASGIPDDIRDPAQLPKPSDPIAIAIDVEQEAAVSDVVLKTVDVERVIARFKADDELQRFVFDDAQIRLVHAALHAGDSKRFILLAGLSGTGKTSMARTYARAYCDELGLGVEQHYEQVSVWPDWTDPSGLLGYTNPLADPPIFHETPALRLLLRAHAHPEEPYFLCLDEMNLARVEHYFAPFLTAMEGRGGRLVLHGGADAVDQIPSSIPWPKNLFLIGTVNMDETTHPFSDKVLDRAFTFEFWTADVAKWAEKNALSYEAVMREEVLGVLGDLYGALEPARRHFGYRTFDEVLRFCGGNHGLSVAEGLDAAVIAKVLPKVRGEDTATLRKALADAHAVCSAHALEASAHKLRAMQDSLVSQGMVRFWS